MEELCYVLTKDFVACVHVRFYFFTAAHFHLAANISHFLTAAMKFSCFSFNIKNNVEKDTTLLLFFLSLGRSVALAVLGHVITKFSRMGRFT